MEKKTASYSSVILKRRLELNLTQEKLAQRLGVSDSTVSKWEKGQSAPDLETIQKLCYELNVSAELMVNGNFTFKDKVRRFLRKIINSIKRNIKGMFKYLVFILFIVLFVVLVGYFVNTYNGIRLYDIGYYSEDISIDNSYFIDIFDSSVLAINKIEIIDLDYEPDNIELELFTYIDGKKYVLYTSDTLDSIYLDDLTLEEINALKNSLYITVNTTYKEKSHNYVSILGLDKSYDTLELLVK